MKHLAALTLAAVFCRFVAPAQGATIAPVISDNFNGAAAKSWAKDWSTHRNAGTVTWEKVPSTTDGSIGIKRVVDNGLSNTTRSFKPLNGQVFIEARVMSKDTTGFKALPTVFSSAGERVLGAGFRGSDLVCTSGETVKVLQRFKVGQWYGLKLEIDTKTSTFSLSVNGVKKLSGAKFLGPAKDVAGVTFGVETASGNGCYFDNVKVYGLAKAATTHPVADVTKYRVV